MSSSNAKPVIVAGVLPDQPLWLLQVAAEYAKTFGASLVCVCVDPDRFAVRSLAEGSLMTVPIESRDDDLTFPEELLSKLSSLLDPAGIEWSAREFVGEPSVGLMRAADELNALMIVVGTRQDRGPGMLRNFFGGSVALRLAHRQYRPVVVVPLEPTAPGERLPWEGERESSPEARTAG